MNCKLFSISSDCTCCKWSSKSTPSSVSRRLQQKSLVVLKAICNSELFKVRRTSMSVCEMSELDNFLTVHLQFHILFRLSFYSGHSSFSMYCMLFLVVSTRLHFKLTTSTVIVTTLPRVPALRLLSPVVCGANISSLRNGKGVSSTLLR